MYPKKQTFWGSPFWVLDFLVLQHLSGRCRSTAVHGFAGVKRHSWHHGQIHCFPLMGKTLSLLALMEGARSPSKDFMKGTEECFLQPSSFLRTTWLEMSC